MAQPLKIYAGPSEAIRVYRGTGLLLDNMGGGEASEVPAGARFVSTTGSDAHVGTAAQPWATVAYGLSQAGAGETLVLRGGIYRESFTSAVSGASGAPVTVMSYPGEYAVISGATAAFEMPGNSAWELFDAASETYRSVGTVASGSWMGSFASAGTLYRLLRYTSLSDLMATTYSFLVSYTYYRGPGIVRHTDGRLYIRLQNLASPRNGGVPAGATAPLSNTPPTGDGFDPRNYAIYVSNANDLVTLTGDHVTWERVEFSHAERAIVFNGASHHSLNRCKSLSHRVGLRFEGGAHDITVNACRWDACHPPYVSWNEIKAAHNGSGEVNSDQKNSIATTASGCHHLTFTNNHFGRYFDGVTVATTGLHHITFDHNRVDYMGDDLVQFDGSCYELRIGWNVVNGPGMGWNGGAAVQGHEDEIYFHHNVLDILRGEFGRRVGEPGDGTDWRLSHNAIPTHSAGDNTAAAKIYNNTFLVGLNINNQGVNYGIIGSPAVGVHAVFNNIIWQRDNREYCRGISVSPIQQIDHNLYYKASSGSFKRFNDWPPGATDYADLAAWRASSGFTDSQAFYAPGYDANSTETDPQFGANATPVGWDYRPAAAAAATGAKNLAATGWPGATAATFRGAVNPAAVTGLGDVGPQEAVGP